MYLCRELTDHSLPAIARRFGGRDHTTVLHAHRKVQREILVDEPTRDLVDGLLRDLKERLSPCPARYHSSTQRAHRPDAPRCSSQRPVQTANPHPLLPIKYL